MFVVVSKQKRRRRPFDGLGREVCPSGMLAPTEAEHLRPSSFDNSVSGALAIGLTARLLAHVRNLLR